MADFNKQAFDMQRMEIIAGYLGRLISSMGDNLQEIADEPSRDPGLAADRGLAFRHMAGEYLDELNRLIEGYYVERRAQAAARIAA